MAVPTITTVSPSTGPAAGDSIVVVTGTNFALYEVPSYGASSGYAPRVRVTIDGEEATNVWVWSSTSLGFATPEYPGDIEEATYPAVDIVLTNLDADGDPVAGETVTKADAFTYQRDPLRTPLLTHEGPVVKVTRTLLQLIKRQVMLSTGIRTHTDYSTDGLITVDAGVPSLFLMDLSITPDAYGYENEAIYVTQQDGSVLCWPSPTMHTFTYTLLGSTDSFVEFSELMAVARKLQRKNPYLLVDGDVLNTEPIRLPVAIVDEPGGVTSLGNANLHTFRMVVEVRRVPVLYLPPNFRTWAIDTAYLEAQSFGGSLVETKTLW